MKIQLSKIALSVLMASSLCGIQLTHAADATDPAPEAAPALNFDCTLTDSIHGKEQPGEAKSTFTTTTPIIYFICDSSDIKKGSKADGVLTAIDTNNAAPANYKVGEVELGAATDASLTNVWHANFNVSKPTKGWPVGSYKYEVFVDGELIKSVNFNIK